MCGGILPILPPGPEAGKGECEKCSPETCIPPCRGLDYVAVPKGLSEINLTGMWMKMNWKTLIFAGVPALVCAAFFAGCATYDNNYLRPEDFAVYLEREGVKVEGVRPLPGEPFRATSGCAVKVADCEVGVYKYDRSSTVQDKRVKKIAEEGRTYIQGIPFPVEVRGSFMFLGLEKNPQKHRIIEVIDKFY